MTLHGIKKAVGDYRRANSAGPYAPEYGYLMLDRSTGELWTDYFYSLGRNEWKQYHDPAVINLGRIIAEDGQPITMATVKQYAQKAIAQYKPAE